MKKKTVDRKLIVVDQKEKKAGAASVAFGSWDGSGAKSILTKVR
jgi:hypothetical protein